MAEEQEQKEQALSEEGKKIEEGMIAIVRVRGGIGLRDEVKKTLELLGLHRQNYCVVVKSTPSMKGMINKVKDFVTFGPVDNEVIGMLKNKGDKKFFRLNPPKKGYGRKGIKQPFIKGGALGNRKEKINDLIKRMM